MSKDLKTLKDFLRRRDDLFRNPTLKGAEAFFSHASTDWTNPLSPLAAVHKARLQWLDVTDAMIAESIAWLIAHNYKTTLKGAEPFTPETRDIERAIHDKPPLKGVK